MKYYLFWFIVSLTSIEVFSIVPKYTPNLEISRRRSLGDTSFVKIYIEPPQINDKDKLADTFINKELRTPFKKPKESIDIPLELDKRLNQLPEVSLKYLINSVEIVNNESVEDFIDLFSEENDGANKVDQTIRKYYTSEKEDQSIQITFDQDSNDAKGFTEQNDARDGNVVKIKNKRIKRSATASYDGRYKSQDIYDVMKVWNSKVVIKPQTQMKKTVDIKVIEDNNDLAKSRLKRSSNIIEEENLVTTNSVKFTGRRPSLLNQDLAYKNIHT